MNGKLHTLVSASLLALALLSGCGNDPQVAENKAAGNSVKVLAGKLLTLGRPASAAPADPAALRATLEHLGLPVYSVKIDKIHYGSFMVPYGNNGPVQTWASSAYETVSLRDGVLVATRGFGADMMSATTPSLSQISAARGSFHRAYYYLDGADQTQRSDFDCNFAASGADTIAVLDKAYVTRRVTESCANTDASFQNVYWFDGSGSLRQSLQYVSPQAASLQLQRVIE